MVSNELRNTIACSILGTKKLADFPTLGDTFSFSFCISCLFMEKWKGHLMLMMSCASSQTMSIRSLLHITSPLWNAMGNSWGNCPSNINHQVEQSVFLSLFFLSTGFFPLLVSMVTATLKDTLQEISPKEKQRMKAGGEGGQRMVRKRQEGCMGVQYFPLRGQPPVSFSAARVLIHRSQGANTNLYSVCVIVFFPLSQHFFLLCCQLVKWEFCIQRPICKRQRGFHWHWGLSVIFV